MGRGILSKLTGVTPNAATCTKIVRTVRYCCSKLDCYHSTGSGVATCERQYDNYGNLCAENVLVKCSC